MIVTNISPIHYNVIHSRQLVVYSPKNKNILFTLIIFIIKFLLIKYLSAVIESKRKLGFAYQSHLVKLSD